MKIILNGREKEFGEQVTVEGLLQQLEVDPLKVVVEHNEKVLPKELYSELYLKENDKLEVLRFVGGG